MPYTTPQTKGGDQDAPQGRTGHQSELPGCRLERDTCSDVLVRDQCRQRGSSCRPVHALKARPDRCTHEEGPQRRMGKRCIGHESGTRRRHDDL